MTQVIKVKSVSFDNYSEVNETKNVSCDWAVWGGVNARRGEMPS